ncbi:sporulation-specific protein 15 [Asbolus verrucosus]|uniref:Sporulation-specific protein 15 n=1 Tax=Asbolus verrucosus TaxID=1661398 RepID=A0A482VTP5_ASBVE|nr:sporulation-specific protein 15 [Asbolus verrucosus]
MTDSYPEYLNPFAEDLKPKSKLSISHSFKEFKRSLRKSFRIKKKEDEEVTIRQKSDTIRRFPMSYPNQQIPLPRSRFRERLTKGEPSTSASGPNPFEEAAENKESKTTTTGRKGKKRAPLPPKSLSSQDVNNEGLEVPTRGSHWSLTSADTNYSDSTDNVSVGTETEANKELILEKIINFNKEMEKLKDDSNNNTITKEEINKETESNNNIPDLVISCPSDTESAKLAKEDKENLDSSQNHSESNINEDTIDEKNNSESDLDDNNEIIVTDITRNMIVDENNKINSIKEEDVSKNEDDEAFLYHEKKSLYIAGSRDELNESENYTGRVSLFITGSTDDLDACNNNEVCDKNGIDDSTNSDDAVPVPKQRKNKLSKNSLLGM